MISMDPYRGGYRGRFHKDNPNGPFPRVSAVYHGYKPRTPEGYEPARVTVDGKNLPLRRDIWNHSTDFEWGYLGSGPSQLSLAILVDCLGDERKAQHLHQSFKAEVIARLPQNREWTLTGQQVIDSETVRMSYVRDIHDS